MRSRMAVTTVCWEPENGACVVVHVWPRQERPVSRWLISHDYTVFCPTHKVKGRAGWIEKALFEGYVFCGYQRRPQCYINSARGVRGFVQFDGRVAVVPDAEIESIRQIVESGVMCRPCLRLYAGQRVEVISGVLQGTKGLLREEQDGFLLIAPVTPLQTGVTVKIERHQVRPIGS